MITVISCGERHGPAPAADVVIDATTWPIPEAILRGADGFDPVIREICLFGNPVVIPALEAVSQAVEALEIHRDEVTVVVICRDGKHRSVSGAEWMAWRLGEAVGRTDVTIIHRDIAGGVA